MLITNLCPSRKGERMSNKSKMTLSNLSIKGQRHKRNRLALSGKESFDNKAYQKKRYAEKKKIMEEWEGWFK